jgi:hypothetical protein
MKNRSEALLIAGGFYNIGFAHRHLPSFLLENISLEEGFGEVGFR